MLHPYISPGRGDDCEAVDGRTLKQYSVIHYHCNALGMLVCFEGSIEECPDEAKHRTLQSLTKGPA